jgi:hypothetical protein
LLAAFVTQVSLKRAVRLRLITHPVGRNGVPAGKHQPARS